MDTGWDLTVHVEDLQLSRRIFVRGDSHIGGVMLKLVESVEVKKDWSDHGLWWPEQNRWLLKTRVTLDQAGLYSGAKLEFHRMHGTILLQLPDLQERLVRVSFSQSVFGVVVSACRELGIRHPEELSLRRRSLLIRPGGGAANGTLGLGSRLGSFRRSKSVRGSSSQVEVRVGTLTNGSGRSGGYNSLLPRQSSQTSSRSPNSMASPTSVNSLMFEGAELTLFANSPSVSTLTAFTERGLAQSRTLADRAVLNEFWLDSSRSLMEQGVRSSGVWDESQVSLQLRYKFHAFYDLNVKYDSIRINQIYEQLKWSVLSEELECSEEEAMLLAALQLQIRLASGSAPVRVESSHGRVPQLLDKTDDGAAGDEKVADDDIDAALADLEASLMSDAHMTLGSPKRLGAVDQRGRSQEPVPSLNKIPELTGYLKFFKPRKFSLRSYRRCYLVLRETQLSVYPDQTKSRPVEEFSLLSSQLTPDVNTATRKFGIRLFVPDPEAPNGQMQEVWLRCDTKEQFADWSAGLSLASRGKSLASRGEFQAEARATATQLELQAPKPQPRFSLDSAPDIDPNDFLPQRHVKSRKASSLLQRILERHANVRDRGAIQAKLDYINVCQRLPTYGVAYFVVQWFIEQQNSLTFSEFRKVREKPREELVGVASNRLMRLDLVSGHIINTWRFEELESWTVNWEVLNLQLRLSRSPHSLVLAPCPLAVPANKQSVCKTLAEFLGGNVFMSLRNPEKSQDLNEQLFHKLTAYRDPKEYH